MLILFTLGSGHFIHSPVHTWPPYNSFLKNPWSLARSGPDSKGSEIFLSSESGAKDLRATQDPLFSTSTTYPIESHKKQIVRKTSAKVVAANGYCSSRSSKASKKCSLHRMASESIASCAQYVTLQTYFSDSSLVIYFFATPPIKL